MGSDRRWMRVSCQVGAGSAKKMGHLKFSDRLFLSHKVPVGIERAGLAAFSHILSLFLVSYRAFSCLVLIIALRKISIKKSGKKSKRNIGYKTK